ncbi:S8 family serine peptidase [Streptomyces sp. ADMS]|uniref:S8 family peptidase n=1 Tax=Streptomyces sp. ADMS TaxID=3071415 RepID=UPI00296EE524|nr:S8 family serine peptidase [Streptomyces sp. ADMS]MDW4905034.1 S8 family serine peptidase [Streptomyces sp. ADMS]
MHILLQLRPAQDITAAVIDSPGKQTVQDVVGDLPGIELDFSYAPVAMPKPLPRATDGDPLSLRQPLTFSLEPMTASVLVRGEIADDDLASRLAQLVASQHDIVGVFADPMIETMPLCADDGPLGTWEDVAESLHVPELRSLGMDGNAVAVAVVDEGINAEHLASAGAGVSVDHARSWSPSSINHTPGAFDVDHGTMCAFDVGIAAPSAELLDVALLLTKRRGRTVMEAYTSDGIAAYAHLRTVLDAMPEESRALVVTNSWGCFSPQWDFAPGSPGNYSDNLGHPFSLTVAALESAGADILFAAGNCGRECPDRRCGYLSRSIVGANSHPKVLSVGGVDITDKWVGYSSQGPGRLDQRKPDVCAYTHFLGSQRLGPGTADDGTSAACPVAAGVLAALRTRVPSAQVTPQQMRQMFQRAAYDPTGLGFTDDYGYGIVSVPGLIEMLKTQGSI